ncbi:cytidine deaminase, partial [bacterium]|nr:cytidine deaminase [bacterium]
FCAVAAGETNIHSIAVVADSPEPVAPCGACRQVMAEFGVQQVFLYNTTGMCKAIEMADLLPYAFGSQQMKGAAVSE